MEKTIFQEFILSGHAMADRGDQVSGALILSQANDQLFHQSCSAPCDKCCKTSAAFVGFIVFLEQGFVQLRGTKRLNSCKVKHDKEHVAVQGVVPPKSWVLEQRLSAPVRCTELLRASLQPELRPRNSIHTVPGAHP